MVDIKKYNLPVDCEKEVLSCIRFHEQSAKIGYEFASQLYFQLFKQRKNSFNNCIRTANEYKAMFGTSTSHEAAMTLQYHLNMNQSEVYRKKALNYFIIYSICKKENI